MNDNPPSRRVLGALPCPFCGGTNIIHDYIRDGREVRCLDCTAAVHAFNPDALIQATIKWNQRVVTHG